MPKFHVSRSIEIAAPPEKVFEIVSDFEIWKEWSPWLIAEPDAELTISKNSNSVGSTYAWEGEVTGSGELEHLRLEAPRLIEDEIRFLKPWKSVSQVSFSLEPAGEGTRITWNMDGKLPFFLFFMKGMMESMIGMDYRRGLMMLKEWIETGKVNSKVNIPGKEITESLRIMGVRRTSSFDEIESNMKRAIDELHQKLETASIQQKGAMLTVYHKYDMKRKQTEFTTGYIIPDSESIPAGLVEWSMPASPVFRVEHVGSYKHLGNGWTTAYMHTRHKKIKQSKLSPYEIYRNSPSDTEEADLVTDIYLPLK
ncbi:MAG: SRPBCC family protein [Planctomycetaceae bacterium]